ncbi:MAG TPA: CBS domain-containing protein [Nitrososphaeraceae archaeon]|nr:CBS domain-containing protein [Nitrososphaeraceae archaeon]
MTKNIKTIQSDKQLFNVCRVMKENRIGSVIVIDQSNNNNPVGIITERDIVNYLSSPDANLIMQVNEIMSKPLVTARETQSLIDALQTMQKNDFRRLPIVNKEGKLVGIVTDKDIFKTIINNKDLLSNIYNNRNFQFCQSILEEYREHLFKNIFQPEVK